MKRMCTAAAAWLMIVLLCFASGAPAESTAENPAAPAQGILTENAAEPAPEAVPERKTVLLPDGRHLLEIPGKMIYQQPAIEEKNLKAVWLLPPDLEMLIFAYDAGGATVQGLAETLVRAGNDAEVREIAGTEFLAFQDTDDTDGAPCVGYGYVTDTGYMIEISFFYATQHAMDLTREIMESFYE